MKKVKKLILTSVWSVQHPNAVQNKQKNLPVLGESKKAEYFNSRIGLRSGATGKLNEVSCSNKLKASYFNYGSKAWNQTPPVIKNCKSLYLAKIEIKKFVKTIPV